MTINAADRICVGFHPETVREASERMYQEPSYPIVRFLLAKGDIFAIVCAVGPILIGLWLAYFGAAIWLAPSLIVSALVWVLLRSYVEVLRIVCDALLPK